MTRGLTFSNTPNDKVERWFDEAEEIIHGQNWLGEPSISVEMHLTDGLDIPLEKNLERLRPKVSEMQILAVFRDIGLAELGEKSRDRENLEDLYNVRREYEEGSWPLEELIRKELEVVSPNSSAFSFYEPVELENLGDTLEQAQNTVSKINTSDSYGLFQIELGAYSEGDAPLSVLNSLEEDTTLSIYFGYRGSDEMLEEYNDSRRGDNQRNSIPGTIILGDGYPYLDMDPEGELSLDKRRIREYLLAD